MFRLCFALISVLILHASCANADNQSTNKVSANGTQQNQCGKTSSKECCNCRDGRDGRDGQTGKDGRDGRDGTNGVKVGPKRQKTCIVYRKQGEFRSVMKGDKGEQGFRGNDGINGTKGDKGEQGFRGNDGINGTKGLKGEPGSSAKPPHGAIKFSDTAENCTLSTAGTVRYSTSQNTLQLCDGSAWLPLVTAGKGQSRGNGLYWIDPNGGSTDDSFQAFCDMDTERGGWTLVASKVSQRFPFIKTGFSTLAAKN
ncbi:hypothetical protein OS493_025612 [Desmophyllum pertusum]|uniref:Fibrillar collagen NC1 domain-containing protein n=1 Tax=Desmophyllum pertusum TaxID=174260 RepID=A0A9W9ZYS1_9CNID|nr:hypothetical protein OS493_025612 [Desmophyllum pertusum]